MIRGLVAETALTYSQTLNMEDVPATLFELWAVLNESF